MGGVMPLTIRFIASKNFHTISNRLIRPHAVGSCLLCRCLSDNNQENSQKPESFIGKLSSGFTAGKWKFYPGDLVFKNLRPDKVPSSYKMCYRSGLETYANISILTGGLMAIISPAVLLSFILKNDLIPLSLSESLLFAFGSIASVAAIYFLCLKVPLRIYYSEEKDNYLVYVPRILPFTTKQLVIKPGELRPPSKSSEYLPWVNIEYTHFPTNRKLLINEETFSLPLYYNKLMGY